jgi:ferritin-like metal-binding protein YciE
MIHSKAETSLMSSLLYELRQLYYSEIISESKYHELRKQSCFDGDGDLAHRYLNGSVNKVQQLEKIFKYLMAEPHRSRRDIISDLTEEAYPLLGMHRDLVLHEISTLGYLQVINSYRVAGYRTAYAFAAQLKLDFVADILQQLLEIELSTERELSVAASELMQLQTV